MAPAEDDISIAEKRVYAGSAGRTDAYVATGTGVVRVAISGDKVGEFGLATREAARDVAVLARADGPDLLAVAADDDLLVAPIDGDRDGPGGIGGSTLSGVGVGSAVAVGVHDGAFLAADSAGGIHRIGVGEDATETTGDDEGDESPAEPTRVGSVDDPRAVDGPLVAAADGVHRVVAGRRPAGVGRPSLEAVGLEDARDVAGAGVPLAATPAGLYWLGNGWMSALEGDATAVAADGDGHALAVVDDDLLVRDGTEDTDAASGAGWDADAWRVADLPVDEPSAALGYGPGLSVVVTDAGTLCVDAGDGWRHQVIGVRGVAGVALSVVV